MHSVSDIDVKVNYSRYQIYIIMATIEGHPSSTNDDMPNTRRVATCHNYSKKKMPQRHIEHEFYTEMSQNSKSEVVVKCHCKHK